VSSGRPPTSRGGCTTCGPVGVRRTSLVSAARASNQPEPKRIPPLKHAAASASCRRVSSETWRFGEAWTILRCQGGQVKLGPFSDAPRRYRRRLGPCATRQHPLFPLERIAQDRRSSEVGREVKVRACNKVFDSTGEVPGMGAPIAPTDWWSRGVATVDETNHFIIVSA